MINEAQKILAEISDKFQRREIDRRELEHRLLGLISVEIERDELDRAVWLKAFSDADGDGDKAKALYIKYRLQRIMDQILQAELQARAVERERTERMRAVVRENSVRQRQNAIKPLEIRDDNEGQESAAAYFAKTAVALVLMVSAPIVLLYLLSFIPESSVPSEIEQTSRAGATPGEELPGYDAAGLSNFTPVTFETSYDCSQATSLADRLVCGNADLAAQDVHMAELYQGIRSSLPPAEAVLLVSDQRVWNSRRDACSNISCVSQIYEQRIEELRQAGMPAGGRDAFGSSPAAPIISNEWSVFQTRIVDDWTTAPAFADQYVIIRIGCGTGCSRNLVGNHQTGEIRDLGLGGEDMQKLRLRFGATSNRITAQWEDLEANTCVRQSYLWDGRVLQPDGDQESTPIEMCVPLI